MLCMHRASECVCTATHLCRCDLCSSRHWPQHRGGGPLKHPQRHCLYLQHAEGSGWAAEVGSGGNGDITWKWWTWGRLYPPRVPAPHRDQGTTVAPGPGGGDCRQGTVPTLGGVGGVGVDHRGQSSSQPIRWCTVHGKSVACRYFLKASGYTPTCTNANMHKCSGCQAYDANQQKSGATALVHQRFGYTLSNTLGGMKGGDLPGPQAFREVGVVRSQALVSCVSLQCSHAPLQ